MSEAWIVEECRRQAVICVVLAGAGEAARGGAKCPQPLFDPAGPPAAVVTRLCRDALQRPRQPAEVSALVRREIGALAPGGLPSAAWTVGELVAWWLEAGETLSSFPAAWRGELEQALVAGVSGQPAALWCAERWATYSLCRQEFARRMAEPGWRERARDHIVCLRKLLNWVAGKDRRRGNHPQETEHPWAWVDAMAREGRELAADAQQLFGPGFSLLAGESLGPATVSQWRVPQWRLNMRGKGFWEEVRRPVVVGEGRQTVLAHGLVVSQPPGGVARAIVARLDGGQQGSDSFTAAVRFAASRWDPGRLVSESWPRAVGGSPAAAPVESEQAFLAVSRTLAAAETRASTSAGEVGQLDVADALRVVLALDGFRVAAEAGDDGAPGRLIPCRGGHAGRGSRRLLFIRDREGFRAEIGWTTPEACPDTRLSQALEEFDWRVWHATIMASSGADETLRGVSHLMIRAVRAADWERLKRRMLASGMQSMPEPLLADAFGYASRGGLALAQLREKLLERGPLGGFGPALEGLIQTGGELAAALLESLHAVDPTALSRMVPPRLATGAVDGIGWLARSSGLGEAAGYAVGWRRDGRPRGQALEERRGDDERIHVILSAGDASDGDIRLLDAIHAASPPAASASGQEGNAWDVLRSRLGERVRGRILSGSDHLDLGADVAWLRGQCEGESAGAFHALVSRRLAGDRSAAEWCRLLAEDSRFRFEVHPRVDLHSGSLPAVVPTDENVTWEFHDTIPSGADISVRYAIVPENARRTVSRGPRIVGSSADLADRLATSAAGLTSRIGGQGAAIRDGTDRWVAFPGRVPHPATVAIPMLRALIDDASPAAERAAVFATLRRWAESVGHEVVPANWSPDGLLDADALPPVPSPPLFHDTVPAGRVVVNALGLKGEHPVPADAALSAGPAPPGYWELRATLEALESGPQEGHTPTWVEAAGRVRDLPRHALAHTLALAGPNLFDCIWETAASGTNPAEPRVEQARHQIVVFLKAACGMVPFQPTALRDYASGWVQESGGSLPRGRRIRSLVRPGLRTIENQLVRPAIVVTE